MNYLILILWLLSGFIPFIIFLRHHQDYISVFNLMVGLFAALSGLIFPMVLLITTIMDILSSKLNKLDLLNIKVLQWKK